MIEKAIDTILAENSIPKLKIEHIKSCDNEHLFFVNDLYLLRISDGNTDRQRQLLSRVAHITATQKLLRQGTVAGATNLSYLLCTKLQGSDFFDSIESLTDSQKANIGKSVAAFIGELQTIRSTGYDIGHYIPIIPEFKGSWQEGHARYWGYISGELSRLGIDGSNRIRAAFDFMDSYRGALRQESGSVLLHNDLHPKNIIINDGLFTGVIDWECSQFGEPDFEYCHFLHWCVFPPKESADLKAFLASVLDESKIRSRFDDFIERQTIYQLEHEMMQIVWSRGTCLNERLPKIEYWLNGGVKSLLQSIA